MSVCEICGKEAEVSKISLEGSTTNACISCSRMGKKLPKIKFKESKKTFGQQEDPEEIIQNFSEIVKEARRKKGLNIKKLADIINEKESTLQRVETNKFTPSFSLAKKLEKQLNIKLIEKVKVEFNKEKTDQKELTLQDIVKIKTRKGS